MQKDRNHAGGVGKIPTIMALCAMAGIVVLLMAAGCTEQQGTMATEENGAETLTVAVTILPQKQFVERIAGEHARVIVLVPPGASPHTHEPTPRQLEEISGASIYFKVGSGIDFERAWMDKLKGVNPRMTIVDSSRGIQLIAGDPDHDEETIADAHLSESEEESGTDPHIWLSPKNARIMVENTYLGLARADPVHAGEYRANADAYLKELDTLDADITREISRTQIRTIMVYHPAWSYFARDYDLVQIPIETDGKDPSPAGIENLIQQAKADNITVIFASPEYSTKSAKVIAEEIGGSVALVDPLEEDYLGNIRNVSAAFIQGGR
ncbi:MAG: zinc ABC transporter substrate-binding protein [Methanoregula sp.]|nr:zinc ABC transporter substrate-binding protein [Methanoregula sp.]